MIWCYWDGIWHTPSSTIEGAVWWKKIPYPGGALSDPKRIIGWRGLADPPYTVMRNINPRYVTITDRGIELCL